MALTQKFGIKFPFVADNRDEIFLDLNESFSESVKSQLLHVLFTPKGQKLRDPEFGTGLMNYLFDPADEHTFEGLKNTISSDIKKYVPNVEFNDISIYADEGDPNARIVIVKYSVIRGNKKESTSVAVKI